MLAISDVCKVKDNEGRTVLHTAAMEGTKQILRKNVTTHKILRLFCIHYYLGLVSACELILLSCDKDILNMKDNQDQTALHLATLSGHGEMVDFLLQHGG